MQVQDSFDKDRKRVTEKTPIEGNEGLKSIIKFTIIPLIPLVFIATISANPELWVIDGQDHFYFEMVSVILSFIVAYYCIMRGYAFNDKFSLFVGLGFHAGGMIDLLHGVFGLLNISDPTFLGYFVPQTWVASRIVTAGVLMYAFLKYKNFSLKQETGSLRKHIMVYTAGLASLAAIITSISLFQPFPFITIDFIIKRPYEIIGAVFFSIALIYFYKNKLHLKKDNFYKGILIALLIDIFVNVIISYSTFVFDTAFSVAHLLKNVSFFVLIMALASGVIQQYKNKNEAEQSLKELTNSLNQKVEERTAQLEEANIQLKDNVKELQKVDKLKQEFMSMMTHELKTPLTPILGWCQTLKRKHIMGDLSAKQEEAIDTIFNNARNLKKLIIDILDAQKLELHKMTFTKTEFKAEKVLRELESDFQYLVEQRGTKLNVKSETNASVYSDYRRISQILGNLVNNAFAFVPEKNGVIDVRAYASHDSVVFSVKDNGKGISKENQKQLFRKFYQADTTPTRKHGGTGLGLSICKGLVENLNGKIWVESDVGQGTVFYFSIPLSKAEVEI